MFRAIDLDEVLSQLVVITPRPEVLEVLSHVISTRDKTSSTSCISSNFTLRICHIYDYSSHVLHVLYPHGKGLTSFTIFFSIY